MSRYNPYANPYAQPSYAGPSASSSSSSYPSASAAYATTTPYATGPQMPYGYQPAPMPAVGGYDIELAQQQSVYTPEGAQRAAQNAQANLLRRGTKEGRKTVLRKGGGEVWEDPSLMEWDPAHFRLFVGDLDPSLSEDQFREAFANARYPSFVKAKIVRDKKTNKGKGYGFVSYSDPEDFLKAWKEMNGKYVGTRPVKISKATAGVAAVNIGAKKASALDAKKPHKTGTVPYERAKAVEAEGGHMERNSIFGPQRVGKGYIRR